MDCSKYEKLISKLIDGELGETSSEALKSHLAACSVCRHTYERMAALNRSLTAVGLYRPPSALASRVKARLADGGAQSARRYFPPAWSQVPLFAMIVLLAIGLGNLAGRSMTEILVGDQSESKLDYLLADAGQSFSDIVLDIAGEENSR